MILTAENLSCCQQSSGTHQQIDLFHTKVHDDSVCVVRICPESPTTRRISWR